ncbi:hypothetical protein HJG60_011396 [Phyllostomus discolor]|uniref:Uncharacterized protein n=1 Tax=Phyllostomus discolor TaxID=89673 RepID=A0A834E5G9_9CHIR|nr:hypothetical protein HJG60_011396 [Phyllostomus discolor]
MVLFSFFFFPFFSFSFLFAAFFFVFFVTVGFCFVLSCFFIKHLRSRTQTQHKRRPPTPTPGAPAGLGGSGGTPWLFFFVAVFLASGTGGQVRGPGAVGGGICTAVPWGDGHKKGYLNKMTTKSGAPTETRGGAHGGAWDTVKTRMGPGRPQLSLEAQRGWGRWASLSGYSNNTLLTGSTFRVLLP